MNKHKQQQYVQFKIYTDHTWQPVQQIYTLHGNFFLSGETQSYSIL